MLCPQSYSLVSLDSYQTIIENLRLLTLDNSGVGWVDRSVVVLVDFCIALHGIKSSS